MNMTKLVSIDLKHKPGVWRMRMYEGRNKVAEATADAVEVSNPAMGEFLDEWRESVAPGRTVAA